jgi:hypothetical protein
MSPPAYLSLSEKALKSQMYKGINFASGGSGLADGTGKSLVRMCPTTCPYTRTLALVVGRHHNTAA